MTGWVTYVTVVVVHLSVLEQKGSDQRRDVGRVAGHEYHAESAPDVDQELVRPRLGRLEVDQSAAQQAPHGPQCRRHAGNDTANGYARLRDRVFYGYDARANRTGFRPGGEKAVTLTFEYSNYLNNVGNSVLR